MLAPALALAICVAYAAALWWLLRRESAAAIAGLVALMGIALAVRIWNTNRFPGGLIEDEPKMLRCAGEALQRGQIANGECVGIPLVFQTLFEVQLEPLLGPTRWAVRSFSLITSVLSVAAAYAVGRALALEVVPSLGIGALVACLPWSIFFGRIALGGELVFHQMLLLAALARLVVMTGAWPDVLVVALGLCGLLHDYFCGRAMVPMPLVAAVLARGRNRLWCVAVLGLAFVGWVPYLVGNAPNAVIGLTPAYTNAVAALSLSAQRTVRALVPPPTGRDSWFTIRAVSVHAPWLLGLATVGSLTGVRRGLFLWAAFLGGLAPSVFSEGELPSAHRMLMAFPVIAIAIGCALNLTPTRVGRALATLAVAALAGAWGVRSYFSTAFWPYDSRLVFSPDRTDVVESLPPAPHPHFIVSRHLGYYFGPRGLLDTDYETHSAGNWLPRDGVALLYVFDPQEAPLRPFYEQLVGAERVRPFGTAFTVSLEARQWSWIAQHGWAYTTRCGADVRRAVVPTFYSVMLGFANLQCDVPLTHTWHGRWQGAPADLRLHCNGDVAVETSRGVALQRHGQALSVDFHVEPGDTVQVTLVTPPPDTSATARLMERIHGIERVPLWESVAPILDDGEPGAATAAAAPISDTARHQDNAAP